MPPSAAVYDHVIVGSGSGGAVVARRLAERTAAQVLLIEAGPDGVGDPLIEDPTRWIGIAGSRYDWGYSYAPGEAVGGRAIPIPRGRVLGGSSATNAMMWYRGHPADYDRWAAEGATGWSFADCLPGFRACEDWQGGESALRGAGGPLRIETSADPHPLALAMLEAADQAGLPVIDDPNGPSNEGAALANFNIAGGRRADSASGYLRPVADAPNLTILTGSKATRLEIADDRVTGVHHRVDGAEVLTRARGEVILAAGAIDTPRLLMLSGIGPEAELTALGIPVRCPAPGVGQNLQDHPLVRACNFRLARPVPPPRDNGGGTILNWRSRPGLDRPDLHAFPVAARSAVPDVVDAYGLQGDLFAIAPGLMRSRARGHLRMLTADPDGPLEIRPNFLGHPDDLAALVEGVRFAMELVTRPAFAPFFGGFAAPETPVDRAGAEAFVRLACSTFFHACGTCRMGADAEAVTDPRLRVNGVSGLRIADASVIPTIPSCNTHAVVTMIGERAATFIQEDA